MASPPYPPLELVVASVADGVGHLRLASARTRNALSARMRSDVRECLSLMRADPGVRCVVLSAEGDVFSAGIDLRELGFLGEDGDTDPGRKASVIADFIQEFQDFVSAFERCSKPVICAIHGSCIGGGLNIITSCDIRVCSAKTLFSLREVRVGLAPDVGALQRLPRVVGCDSWVRDLAFTGRDFGAEEALRFGLVQEVFESQEATVARALALGRQIAANSPLAVSATKASLNFSRDHTVADGLQHIMLLNRANLQAPDLQLGVRAALTKGTAQYPDMPAQSRL